MSYNPASIFAQVDSVVDDKNGNVTNQKEENGKPYTENSDNKEKVNTTIKSVGIYCGYDYTVAMQPGKACNNVIKQFINAFFDNIISYILVYLGGTILAWGNNNRAQLGRISVKDTRDTDEKIVLLKSSNIILDVPNIPAPIISYQSYDIPSLAGFISPLSVIEKSPAELTLHYVLEHFNGLYDSTKIMEKVNIHMYSVYFIS